MVPDPSRPDLSPPPVTAAARKAMEELHADTVARVREAVAQHPVVVVGMAWNQPVRVVRNALTEAGVEHHYVEVGNYLNRWRERLAIKLWTGWPTFPQVFVRGTFVGGSDLTLAALRDGSLQALRDAK